MVGWVVLIVVGVLVGLHKNLSPISATIFIVAHHHHQSYEDVFYLFGWYENDPNEWLCSRCSLQWSWGAMKWSSLVEDSMNYHENLWNSLWNKKNCLLSLWNSKNAFKTLTNRPHITIWAHKTGIPIGKSTLDWFSVWFEWIHSIVVKMSGNTEGTFSLLNKWIIFCTLSLASERKQTHGARNT